MRTKLEKQGMQVKEGGVIKAVLIIQTPQYFSVPMIACFINIFWCVLNKDIFPNIVCKLKSEGHFLI